MTYCKLCSKSIIETIEKGVKYGVTLATECCLKKWSKNKFSSTKSITPDKFSQIENSTLHFCLAYSGQLLEQTSSSV